MMSEFDCGWVEDESGETSEDLEYTAEYVANRLEQLSDAAYGWNVCGKVVGIPVSEFERLMDAAAEMIRKS